MKHNTVNELQALNNAINSYNLKGYSVHQNYSSDKRKKIGTYCLVDNKGISITGWWDYIRLNHFIMGYGKTFSENEILKGALNELMTCYNRDKHLLNFNVDTARKAIQTI